MTPLKLKLWRLAKAAMAEQGTYDRACALQAADRKIADWRVRNIKVIQVLH